MTPFLRRVAGARLWRTLVTHLPAVAGAAAHRDRDRLKELAVLALRGHEAAEVDRLGRSFADQVAQTWLRNDTVARLAWHREAGDATVVVSASLECYVRPLGLLLGVDHVIATRLEADADGVLTGRLDGANCRGQEKARRLTAWLDERGLEWAELWAYGDSAGDEQLLALADIPVWVRGVEIDVVPAGRD